MVIEGHQLSEKQKEIKNSIINSDAFYHIVKSSRQFGKSFLLLQLLLFFSINNPKSNSLVTAPINAQVERLFFNVLYYLKDSGIIRKSNATHYSISLINGSTILFKTLERPNNIRGESIDYLFCDEAAFYKSDVFYTILQPMLLVKGKKCLIFSTPKGKNFFYELYHRELNGDSNYKSYNATYKDNPFAKLEVVEDSRKHSPPAIFRQEFLAEFIEDGGEVFTNVESSMIVEKYEHIEGEITFAGLDLGRVRDYTALTIINEFGVVRNVFRVKEKEWSLIVHEVAQILLKYKCRDLYIEVNNVGDVIYDMLKKVYKGSVTAFNTTNVNKQEIIENLIASFQDGLIQIPTKKLNPDMIDEINDFGFKFLSRSRNIQYAARSGHDDLVISLALANFCLKKSKNKGQYIIL